MNEVTSSPRIIFFDESGYTGGDLLNNEQPIFSVGSSVIADDLARDILKQSFPSYQGPEIKFRHVWSSWRNRKGLLRFAEAIAQNSDYLFAYFIDKKFCVLTKFVDFLIEPVLHDAGYDFHANGYAPTFCNRFKFGLDNFCEASLYESTIKNYQRFTMNPTPQALEHLELAVRFMATSAPAEVRDYYEMASMGIARFRERYEFSEHHKSNEIQLTTVLASVAYWRQKSDHDLAIIHDQSSNFFSQARLWEKITNPDVPAQIHNAAGSGSFPFPLRVVSTEAGDSRTHPAIQICDVVSGLITRAKRADNSTEEKQFLQDVIAAGLGELNCDGILPRMSLADGPPKKLNGPDAVDQMKDIIFGPHS